MDTDYLSNETYNAVLMTAEKFNHDLTLQFGLLSYKCNTEDKFLDECEKLINNWLSDVELSMTDIFFDDIPTKKNFKNALLKILKGIHAVRKIPINKRIFN